VSGVTGIELTSVPSTAEGGGGQGEGEIQRLVAGNVSKQCEGKMYINKY